MLLLERAWKDNEMAIQGDWLFTLPYVANAIGKLKPQYGKNVLEHIALDYDGLKYGTAREAAARALDSLADDETLAKILGYFEKKVTDKEYLGGAPVEILELELLLDRHIKSPHRPMLQEYARNTKNEVFKDQIVKPLLAKLEANPPQ